MKTKNIFIVVAVLFTILSVSCVSTQVEDEISSFEKELFSSSKYIAQRGYGTTHESAKNAALANISRYFYQSIKVKSEERVRITDSGTDSTIDEETFIESQTELFAVHYLDAVQDEKGEWQCVAYIDRDEAWQIYEKQIERGANAFSDLYVMASGENDDLKRALYFINAKKIAVKNELASKLDFSAVLYPPSTAMYAEVSDMLGSVDAHVRKAVSKCATYIVCEPYEDTLHGGISAVLSSDGFPTVEKESDAKYICRMNVYENKQTLNAGVFYTPKVEIFFLRDGSTAASYEFTAKRTGASDANIARQRALNAVVSELKESMIENLSVASNN